MKVLLVILMFAFTQVDAQLPKNGVMTSLSMLAQQPSHVSHNQLVRYGFKLTHSKGLGTHYIDSLGDLIILEDLNDRVTATYIVKDNVYVKDFFDSVESFDFVNVPNNDPDIIVFTNPYMRASVGNLREGSIITGYGIHVLISKF